MEREERKFEKGCLWDIFITLLEFESLCELCNTLLLVVRCTLEVRKKSVSSIHTPLSSKPYRGKFLEEEVTLPPHVTNQTSFIFTYAEDLIGICILPRLNSVVFLQATSTCTDCKNSKPLKMAGNVELSFLVKTTFDKTCRKCQQL